MDPSAPTSMEEVECLIQELYQPGPPQKIARIQETLQKLQRSPEGWQIADYLLESSDEKIKFFGALTFTVKLNSDSKSLSSDDADALLGRLLGCLVGFLRNSVGPLVIRKLCSTLVVYFLHFPMWHRCVRHLIMSLCIGGPASAELIKEAPETSLLVEKLTAEQMLAALWFTSGLAEEVGKTDANNIKHNNFHERLKENIDDVVCLMGREIVRANDASQVAVRQDSMRCFQAWITYSHRAFIDAEIVLEPLKTVTKSAISCIVQVELYEIAIELFSDILTNYSKFFRDEELELLFSLFNSDWSRERYNRLIEGDFSFESLQYGQFMIAFGDATIEDLARKNDPSSQRFISALGGLLAANGYPVAEDQIFVRAVEFWSTFVEVMIDSLYSDETAKAFVEEQASRDGLNTAVGFSNVESVTGKLQGSWFENARLHVMQAIENCWRKCVLPPAVEFDSWDSSERMGLLDARKDVADLLQASYTLTGVPLFLTFARTVTETLESQSWDKLEASLFCLNSLADVVPEDDAFGEIMEVVFGSPLLTVLTNSTLEVPLRTRHATLSLIGQYDGYFKIHKHQLPNALTFLFEALRTPELAITAARSISTLCSACRQDLTSELTTFLQQYGALTQNIDSYAKEKVLGAIASIIQAILDSNLKLQSLLQLIYFVELDVEHCYGLLSSGDSEKAEGLAIEVLKSLASIAHGLQIPPNKVVDLTTEESIDSTNFWVDGPGVAVQDKSQAIINKLTSIFPNSGAVIDGACSVFRAGFVERVPGPFVFPAGTVAEFILKASLQTPQLSTVIGTGCALISSRSSSSSQRVDGVLKTLLPWLLAILQSLGDPATDPEISQVGIDFISRLVPVYISVLMEESPAALEFIFMFILKALTGNDPLPKYAAAEFWSSFVSLANLPAALQTSTRNIMQQLGPSLAQALIWNVGGNAARSELDKIADPLKKLVVGHVHSKHWLEDALFAKDFGSNKVHDSEKRIFLQKIFSLRGAKQSNQVVKDFWLACRGSNFAYAS